MAYSSVVALNARALQLSLGLLVCVSCKAEDAPDSLTGPNVAPSTSQGIAASATTAPIASSSAPANVTSAVSAGIPMGTTGLAMSSAPPAASMVASGTGSVATAPNPTSSALASATPSGVASEATSASPSASASPSMSISPPVPGVCDNNRKDGDEENVDCGGSCPACVDYDIGPPQPNNADPSGCETKPNPGFMCPQSMLFSPTMKQAAADDWGAEAPPFVYGVVGHDPDPGGVDGNGAGYSASCCECYQLVFKEPLDSSVSMTTPKPMIVQGFNTYAGGPSAFDVYMAGGGHGNFNGCTENGAQYSGYPELGGDWTGGVRATRYQQCSGEMRAYSAESVATETCQSFIEDECNKIAAEELTQDISRQSCVQGNRAESHYHMNWAVVVQRVQCPENLTKVTGCRLADTGLPAANPEIDTYAEAMAAGFRETSSNAKPDQDARYHTTTMQDCCRPTCAWDANTANTSGGYNRFYTCNKSGVAK